MNSSTSLSSEPVLYRGHLHWVLFILPFLLISSGIFLIGLIEYHWNGYVPVPFVALFHSPYIGTSVVRWSYIGLPFIFVGVVWGLHAVLIYLSSSLNITAN